MAACLSGCSRGIGPLPRAVGRGGGWGEKGGEDSGSGAERAAMWLLF